MQNVLVVGGGELADVIRRLDSTIKLSPKTSHRLALQTMSINSSVIAECISNCVLTDCIERIRDASKPVVIFDSCTWIARLNDVPASWDFTSDSVAARLAVELSAKELVLIKSRLGELNEPGFVDSCFAKESQSLPNVRVCTLSE
jgi:aspartokinase-like uncharacterized kinase